jgi:hypothetical protein
MKNADVTLEIRFDQWKFGNRDFQNVKMFHKPVIIIRKRLSGTHHVVQGNRKLSCHGIGSFFLFAGLAVEVVSPLSEHFGMVAAQPVGTGYE